MTKQLQLIRPDGLVCDWTAAEPETVRVLNCLQEITGLTNRGRVPSYRCHIHPFQPEKHQIHRWRRQPAAVVLPESGREIFAYPFKPTGQSLSRQGFLVRQLFFLGILPLLLRGQAVLVHGALAERNGDGICFCGPSGIGKSTTVSRLPADFQILADDCFLLSEHDGAFFAQAVPTWSIWTGGKCGTARNCHKTVELKKIYLLERGEPAVIPLNRSTAQLGFIPSLTEILLTNTSGFPEKIRPTLLKESFEQSFRILSNFSVHRLRLRLDSDLGGLLN